MSFERLDVTTSGNHSSSYGLFLDIVAKSKLGVTIIIEAFALHSDTTNPVTVTIYECSEGFGGNTNCAVKWTKVGCGAISKSGKEIGLSPPVSLVEGQKRGFYFHTPDSSSAIPFTRSDVSSIASNTWFDVHSGPFQDGKTPFASVRSGERRAMFGTVIFSQIPDQEQLANKHRKTMQEAFWTDTSFSDCTIKVPNNAGGTRILKCHRVVLGTASPVWSAALQSNFREGNEASITIHDFDPSVVEAAVKYAYTNHLPEDAGVDLIACLKLAHMYEMLSLVEVCAQHVILNLTVDNVGQAVAAFNTLSDSNMVESLWPTLFTRVRSNEALNQAALRSLGRV